MRLSDGHSHLTALTTMVAWWACLPPSPTSQETHWATRNPRPSHITKPGPGEDGRPWLFEAMLAPEVLRAGYNIGITQYLWRDVDFTDPLQALTRPSLLLMLSSSNISMLLLSQDVLPLLHSSSLPPLLLSPSLSRNSCLFLSPLSISFLLPCTASLRLFNLGPLFLSLCLSRMPSLSRFPPLPLFPLPFLSPHLFAVSLPRPLPSPRPLSFSLAFSPAPVSVLSFPHAPLPRLPGHGWVSCDASTCDSGFAATKVKRLSLSQQLLRACFLSPPTAMRA